ncbi:MAG: sulfite exporter TauE/SafE family protein [Flavobacteriales bacterium]|nr:sulfite exporter TauE/SafE family protein [Flavobacteriales bacterium]
MIAVMVPALVLGVLGSAHCVAMCGPLHLAVGQGGAPMRTTVLLNTGRVITYMVIGALFGLFGRGLGLAGVQRFVAIALAVLMLAALVVPALAARLHRPMVPSAWVARLRSAVARRLRRSSAPAVLITGMLNGLLPCGMVYVAVAGALAQEGPMNGALFMAAFGAGTWPALFAVRSAGATLGARFRTRLARWAPAGYVLMAALLLVRGLALDIPYLSPPDVEVPMRMEACP